MKRVLYITNIQVPYRTEFFNQFSKFCDLTVLYERSKSKNRAKNWADQSGIAYRHFFLNGIKIGNENAFSFRILKYIFGRYDAIVIGCFNSPVEMLAILFMKMLHRPYYLNVDGELFTPRNPLKRKIRNFFLRGAHGYFCAGEKSIKSLYEVTKSKNIVTYKFSSLNKKELEAAEQCEPEKRNDTILVVGQYEDYKGLDIAAQAAKRNPNLSFKFVGMGGKKEAFLQYIKKNQIENIEVIPFLSKDKLQEEYKSCRMLVLPSRQECWGLVINEGAAWGIPIAATWGSGAARDFLKGKYEQFLAEPDNAEDLGSKILALYHLPKEELDEYASYLYKKAREYYIEENVMQHVKGLAL